MPLSTVTIRRGAFRKRELDDLRREAVAVLEPVRDQEIDGTECSKTAHADGAAGGAVGVVVGNDQDALARRDGIGEPCGRGVDVEKR